MSKNKIKKPQKTVSFDQDIFDYINKNRDRIKFADFMNQLLSDHIKIIKGEELNETV